jgi:protease I
MTEKLKGRRVAILVTDGFEQVELTEPRKALEAAGAETVIVAPKAGKVQGMNHDEKADQFEVGMTTGEADPDELDAVLLPGGVINADKLRMDTEARELVRRIDRAGKPIAVICHGAWLLVSADLVKGRTLTSYHTVQDDIRNAGGNWVNREVVRDGNWVSSRKPDDLPAFNDAMVQLLDQVRGRRQPEAAESQEVRP